MKHQILLRVTAVVFCAMFCVFLFGATLRLFRPLMLRPTAASTATCTTSSTPGSCSASLPTHAGVIPPSPPVVSVLPDGVTQLNNGTAVFRATADDLICCYNHRWGSNYMRPLDSWRRYTDNSTPCNHTNATRYSFLAEEAIHYWPAIDLYLTEGDSNILEVSLSLSQHDWSMEIDDIFKAQCLCTLSVFFPDLPEDTIEALYNQLRQEAQNNEYIPHSAVPVPKQVSVLNKVGCWGYTYSGMIRINIIPVDDAFLTELTAKGIKIKQISR